MKNVREFGRTLLAAAVMTAALGTGAASAQDGDAPTVLLFGDSLLAGYGLSPNQGFASQLQAALAAEGIAVDIENASISGDTTANGLERIDWTLAERPDVALVGLGANDMLRGISPETARANLTAILDRFADADIPVLLLGMMAQRNLGSDYVQQFDAIYPELADSYDNVALYPFFLQGVALDRSLNLPDGLHPNANGIAIIVDQILPDVVTLLEQAG